MPTPSKLSLLSLSLILLVPATASLASGRPGADLPPSRPSAGPSGSTPGLSPAQARQLVEGGRKRVEQRTGELERARQEVYKATQGPALEAAKLKRAAAEAALATAETQLQRWQAILTSLGPGVAAPDREEAREVRAPQETKETKLLKTVLEAERARAGAGSAAPVRNHPFFTWSKRQAPGDLFRFTPDREGWASFPEKLVLSDTGSLFWWDREGKAIHRLDPNGRQEVHFKADGHRSRAQVCGWSAGPDGVCLLSDLQSEKHKGLHFFYIPRNPRDTTHPQVMAPLGLEGKDRALALVPPYEAGSGREAVAVLPRQLLFFSVGDPRGTFTVLRNQVAGPDLGPDTVLLKRPGASLWFLDPGRGTVGFLRFPTADQYEVIVQPFDGKAGHLALRRAGTTSEDDEIFITFPDQDRIGRYRYRSRTYEEFRLRRGTAPGAIVAGPGGHMIFATADGFGRFAPDGQITRLPVHGRDLRPLDLWPNFATGKLYFTERDRNLLGALTLGEPGKLTDDGALCGAPAGDSLLAPEDEMYGIPTTPSAPVVRKQPTAAAGAGPAAPTARVERKALAAGMGAGVGAGAGAAGAAGAGADLTEPEDPPSDPEEDEDPFAEIGLCMARVSAEDSAAPARIVRLVNRRISPGSITHIQREHAHQEVALMASRRVKGQFTPDLLKDEREFRRLLWRCANEPEAEVWYEGPDDTVIEFTTQGELGRVCPPGSQRWLPSRRLRLVLTRDPETGRDWLTTAYPVLEAGLPEE